MKRKEIENNVINILIKYPFARNNDNWLIDRYFYHYKTGIECYSLYDQLKQIPPIESITRARRRLQAQGLYQAHPDNCSKRRKLALECKAYEVKEITHGKKNN